jgi:hypothetical protein
MLPPTVLFRLELRVLEAQLLVQAEQDQYSTIDLPQPCQVIPEHVNA